MNSKLNDLKLDVEEIHKLMETATRRRVKEMLGIEARKLETEMIRLKESSGVEFGATGEPAAATAVAKDKCYTVKLSNYAWDQSDKFVKIYVTLKNVQSLPPEQTTCSFDSKSFKLDVKGLESRNYTFEIIGLLNAIDPDKSHWKVKNDKVIVSLAKAKPNNWAYLTAREKEAKQPAQEPDLDKDDPTAGFMNIMKKMYDEGDDDMKRTIAKAWTENQDKNELKL